MISLIVSFFPVHKFRGVNVKIGISTAQPVLGKSINTWRMTVKEKWANKLIVISIITFETMEKFIRFRARRCWCIIFVCYMPFNIDPWFLFSSLGSRRRNLNKMPHLCNLPTGWTKLLHEGSIFKDTMDPRERLSDRIFKRAFGVQLNYKSMKKKCFALACNNSKGTIFR